VTFSTVITILSSSLLGNPALAESKSNIKERKNHLGSMLEEVVVTARKREEGLQDAPLSVSAFSGDSLDIRGLTNIAEIGSITPNLTYQNNPGSGGSSSVATVYIRGVGQRDFLGTIDNGVGFYIDDVYIARTVGATVDLLDVDRVEILRGPQGTLFGRNNVGGAIALHTKRPAETFGGYVSATMGTDNQHKVKASVNVPISDNLLSNFSAMWGEQDGYVDRPAGGDLGDDDVTALRGNLLWLASDTVEISISADFSSEDENGPAFQLIDVDEVGQFGNGFPGFYNNVTAGATCSYANFGPFKADPACYNDQYVGDDNFGTAPTYSETDVWGVKLGVKWDISDTLSLKSITSYRDLDAEFARDSDASPLSVVHYFDAFESEQFTQEFQLIGTAFDGKLDWIAGLYYFNEDGFNQNVLNFAIADFDSRNNFSSTSKAVFTQATYHATEKLHVTLGARYTDEEKTFNPNQRVTQSRIGVPTGAIILPLGNNSRTTYETTPLVNISYDIMDNLMVYVNYAEGFRSGGYVQRVFPPRPDIVDFDPEFVKSYELGFKYGNDDGSLTLNGAVFFMDYDDIQVRVPKGVAQTEDNVGKAEISGAELELKWQPAETWFVEMGVGYTNAKFTEIDIDIASIPKNPDGSLTVNLNNPFTVIQQNNEFDHVPEWSVNASVAKELDLADNGSLLIRLSSNYQSGYFNEPLNTPQLKTPEQDLWDLTLVWTSPTESFSINAGIKNLTDEEYLSTGFFNPTIGTIEVMYDRGQQWFMTGRYNF